MVGLATNTVSVQTIVDNYNGTYSTFIVDSNLQFRAFASFSPLPEASGSMTDSWNTYQGFQLWIYTNTYSAPPLLDQIGSYLVFGANIILYFLNYAGYIITVMSFAGTLIGLAPQVGAALMVLLIIMCGGSILMNLRGIGEDK
jgi:hypothetical protein